MTNYTGYVRLECDHELYFDTAVPRKNEEIWCRRCESMRKVAEPYIHPHYRIKCKTCRYAKACGTARLAAEIAIVRHRNKHGRHHRMVLMNHKHEILWETGGENPDQLELPIGLEAELEAEIVATAKEIGKRTRELGANDPPPY